MSRSTSTEDVLARPQHRCVVCGPDHPHGFHLEFRDRDGGGVAAEWEAGADWEGFAGVLHGGVISTLLDESMAKAVMGCQWRGMTVELRVRYRHHVSTGERLRIEGWVTERRKRRVLVEATVKTTDGDERAHGWGTFLLVE